MKITIDRQPVASGLFSLLFGGGKVQTVKVSLEVSDDEERAIRKQRLKHHVLYQIDRDIDGKPYQDPRRIIAVTVEMLIQGKGRVINFSTPAEAQAFDRALREQVFPNLKAMMDGKKSSSTFEL